MVYNPYYNKLKLEKNVYNDYFGEDCDELFVYEASEFETHLKLYFENEIENKYDTIVECDFDRIFCWLCEEKKQK